MLIAGLTKSRLTFEGAHFRYNDVPMELRAVSNSPTRRCGTRRTTRKASSTRPAMASISWASAQLRRCAQHVDAYWPTWELHGHDPGRLNADVATPKVGILRHVVVAETDAEALAITRAAHGDWYRSITKLWHDHDDHSVDGLFAWETATQHETMIFGSPARVREQMRRLVEASGCNYVICAFAWGTLPHQQTLRSLRLFAQEVMPEFAGGAVLTDTR